MPTQSLPETATKAADLPIATLTPADLLAHFIADRPSQ
jgi:hypothetical protein